jgi:hypothetical protein
MSDQPAPPESAAPPFEIENYQDYAGALRSVGSARSLFLLLVLLSLLIHAVLYTLARWTPDLVGLPPAVTETTGPVVPADADQQLTDTDAAADAPQEVRQALAAEPGSLATAPPPQERQSGLIEAALPLAAFVGLASGILLLFCYLLSVNIALSGHLGGVRGSLAALIWMAIVVLLLLPWQGWLGGWGVNIPGAYLTADEVLNVPAQFEDLTTEVVHNVRCLGYPLLVLLIAVVGDRRYARGYRLAQRQIQARLAVRRI